MSTTTAVKESEVEQIDHVLGEEYEHVPVPSQARRSLFSVTMVWIGFPMIITGAMTGSVLVLGMGFQRALIAMIIGNLIMFALDNSMVDVHAADTADYFGPTRHHRRPLEPARRRSHPAPPRRDHQRRLRPPHVEILCLDPVEVQRVTEDSRPSDPCVTRPEVRLLSSRTPLSVGLFIVLARTR